MMSMALLSLLPNESTLLIGLLRIVDLLSDDHNTAPMPPLRTDRERHCFAAVVEKAIPVKMHGRDHICAILPPGKLSNGSITAIPDNWKGLTFLVSTVRP